MRVRYFCLLFLLPALLLGADAETLAANRANNTAYQQMLGSLRRSLASESQRREALLALARLQDPQVIPDIARHLDADLHDLDTVVAACIAAGLSGDASLVTPLRRLVGHSQDQLHTAALAALDALNAIGHNDQLREASSSQDPIRGSAVTRLGIEPQRQSGEALLRALDPLTERDVHVRRMAAIGLGRLGDSSYAPDLINALSDPDALVRRYAAEALSALDHKPAIPYLLIALEAGIAGNDLARALAHLVGQDFGWRADADPSAKMEALRRGFAWWSETGADLHR